MSNVKLLKLQLLVETEGQVYFMGTLTESKKF